MGGYDEHILPMFYHVHHHTCCECLFECVEVAHNLLTVPPPHDTDCIGVDSGEDQVHIPLLMSLAFCAPLTVVFDVREACSLAFWTLLEKTWHAGVLDLSCCIYSPRLLGLRSTGYIGPCWITLVGLGYLWPAALISESLNWWNECS